MAGLSTLVGQRIFWAGTCLRRSLYICRLTSVTRTSQCSAGPAGRFRPLRRAWLRLHFPSLAREGAERREAQGRRPPHRSDMPHGGTMQRCSGAARHAVRVAARRHARGTHERRFARPKCLPGARLSALRPRLFSIFWLADAGLERRCDAGPRWLREQHGASGLHAPRLPGGEPPKTPAAGVTSPHAAGTAPRSASGQVFRKTPFAGGDAV